jgi:hypothetical protein
MNQVGSLEQELRELRRELAHRQVAPTRSESTTRQAA